jgi:hypothetical protein
VVVLDFGKLSLVGWAVLRQAQDERPFENLKMSGAGVPAIAGDHHRSW